MDDEENTKSWCPISPGGVFLSKVNFKKLIIRRKNMNKIFDDPNEERNKENEENKENEKNEEKIKPFTRGNPNGEMIKPFTVGNPNGEKIKPFVVGDSNGKEDPISHGNAMDDTYDISKSMDGHTESSECDQSLKSDCQDDSDTRDFEMKECEKSWEEGETKREESFQKEEISYMNRKSERPIQYISDSAVRLAEGIYKGNRPEFIPYLAKALDDFQKREGKIGEAIPMMGDISGQSPLNFTLGLERIIYCVSDTEDGEKFECQYCISVTVFQHNGKTKEFSAKVASEKIKDANWLKGATNSLASIPQDKTERNHFQNMIQNCIETENVPCEIIYPNPGWRDVPSVGWRYVYGEGVVGDHSGWIHTLPANYKLVIDWNKLGSKDIFENVVEMAHVCKNKMASFELVLFVHASMIATLFEKAGHRINFLFGICGVTNSRKTSLTLALAKVFGRDDPSKFKADAQFAVATRCGIETTLSLYKDAPVIIDDFKPGSNSQEQREMDRKLDELARFYGDGIAKKRMNDYSRDSEKKFFPIYGGCILTMEIITGVLSSVARMFITEIDAKEVDNERLRFYQENLWVLPTHLYDFLGWVTDKFDLIVSCISEKFIEFRNEYRFKVARYAEMYATFKVTALLISRYAGERGFWDEAEKKGFLFHVEEMIVKELYLMENRIKNHDKTTLLLKVLDDAIHNMDTVFTGLTTESCAKGESCYEDENFFYMQTKELKRMSKEYCAKFFERDQIVTENEIINLLERLEVLDIRENKNGRERSRKLPMPRGNTKRYLYINKERLKEHLEHLE